MRSLASDTLQVDVTLPVPDVPVVVPDTPVVGGCVTVPFDVICPIAFVLPASVNHRLPSGPDTSPSGELPGFKPVLNSVIPPLVVTRPIAFVPPRPVNHRLPSGPDTSSAGELPGFKPVLNSVIPPLGVTRPIAFVLPASVNHRLPSGPETMSAGALPAFKPVENSVITPGDTAAAITAPATSKRLVAALRATAVRAAEPLRRRTHLQIDLNPVSGIQLPLSRRSEEH